MAFGTHWEWRGFGKTSQAFLERFGRLDHAFGPFNVEDLYLWAPGLQTNVKIREGEMGGLKFKRLLDRDGRLEKYVEDPAELFALPLTEQAWRVLAAELGTAGITIGPAPGNALDSDRLVAILERAGCRIVWVSKEREGRWSSGPNGRVLVERTDIHKPQPILSISLESEDIGDGGLSDDQAKEDLRAAIALGLDLEPLRPLNYMDAVTNWAQGSTIRI